MRGLEPPDGCRVDRGQPIERPATGDATPRFAEPRDLRVEARELGLEVCRRRGNRDRQRVARRGQLRLGAPAGLGQALPLADRAIGLGGVAGLAQLQGRPLRAPPIQL